MQHGIVPRPRFTKCPTVYAVASQQGQPVSEADKKALEAHDASKVVHRFLGRRRNETVTMYLMRRKREGRL